jgi:hypothetical protein
MGDRDAVDIVCRRWRQALIRPGLSAAARALGDCDRSRKIQDYNSSSDALLSPELSFKVRLGFAGLSCYRSFAWTGLTGGVAPVPDLLALRS